ncbi:hypothetical protein PENTCL1PPCAC_8988, partial [Pristionchus entomophagus]
YNFNAHRMITKAGQKEGLSITFAVQQSSPKTGQFDFLPTSRSANMWISVYSDGEPPDFSTGQYFF